MDSRAVQARCSAYGKVSVMLLQSRQFRLHRRSTAQSIKASATLEMMFVCVPDSAHGRAGQLADVELS